MTITGTGLALYAFGIFLLFATPGPVWVALIARAMSGGFQAAWPLALGVVIGDVIWPLFAMFGMGWILSTYGDFLEAMTWIACALFVVMGVSVIHAADKPIGANSALTRPGKWAGFVAGLAIIASNPKAILFYMGLLPGFFDLTQLTWIDIALICSVSFFIPLSGNLILAAFVGQIRAVLKSPKAVRRLNFSAGGLLIFAGLLIPFI